MYDKETKYKFSVQIDDFKSLFTGTVVEEDDTHIKVWTIRNESMIFKKTQILKAVKMYGG